MTPTQLSLRYLRAQGYLADVVERWIPGANIRRDLFGIADICAVADGKPNLLVQTTSRSNMAARVKKITEHENVDILRKAGLRILVHGWAKKNGRWQLKETDLS